MISVIALEWLVVALVAATAFAGGWLLKGRDRRRSPSR